MLHTMNVSQLSLEMQAQYFNRADTPMEQKANMTGALLSLLVHDREEIMQLQSKNQTLESKVQQTEQQVVQLTSQLKSANAGISSILSYGIFVFIVTYRNCTACATSSA